MLKQKTLRFSLDRKPGQMAVNHRIDEAILNTPRNLETTKPAVKRYRLAEILKRQSRAVMADVTECPPDTMAAHLARLDGLREIISHALNGELAGTTESRYSGKQMTSPYTLADYLECLNQTRKTHRAPAFVNQRDADIAQIKQMICTLAGLVATNSEALELFQRQYLQSETGEAA